MNRKSKEFLALSESVSRFFRSMFDAGVSSDALMKVINHDSQSARVAAYIKAGCPEIELVDGKLFVTLASTDQFLTIESDLAFEDRITHGNYDWRNDDLTEERFPVMAAQAGDWE